MADLTELTSSVTVKIVGSNSSGVEQTPVNSTTLGDLNVIEVMNNSAVAASISVSTTAVEMKVGGTTLANRKMIILEAQAAGYTWGFTNILQPFTLPNGSPVSFQLGPNITIWVKKASGTSTVSVAEIS